MSLTHYNHFLGSPFLFDTFLDNLTPKNETFNKRNVVQSSDTHTTYSFSFAGLRKEDIILEMSNGKLHIHGTSNISTNNYSETVSYSESMSIPKNLRENEISATYRDGLLYITVPNKSSNIENRQRIQIQN